MRRQADLLLHPVRLRIVQALAGGRRLSARELGVELGDVTPATLYRHVAALSEAGVLALVEQRPARGTPERVYALVQDAARVAPEELASASTEDHMRWFSIFVGGVLGDFGRYLAGEVDFVRDGVGYRQIPLELTDGELAELTGRLHAALAPVLANRPAPERRRRMFTTILIPASDGRVEPEEAS